MPTTTTRNLQPPPQNRRTTNEKIRQHLQHPKAQVRLTFFHASHDLRTRPRHPKTPPLPSPNLINPSLPPPKTIHKFGVGCESKFLGRPTQLQLPHHFCCRSRHTALITFSPRFPIAPGRGFVGNAMSAPLRTTAIPGVAVINKKERPLVNFVVLPVVLLMDLLVLLVGFRRDNVSGYEYTEHCNRTMAFRTELRYVSLMSSAISLILPPFISFRLQD